MSEEIYWYLIIKWFEKNNITYAFAHSHKTQLLNSLNNQDSAIMRFLIEFGYNGNNIKKVLRLIESTQFHNIKIHNTIPDFIFLKKDPRSPSLYVCSAEIKGETGLNDVYRGLTQARQAQNGVHFSILVIPESTYKKLFESPISENIRRDGIILGVIKKKLPVEIELRFKEYARTFFDPKINQEIFTFLNLIEKERFEAPLVKFQSGRTMFLHYIVPGFLKFLINKYFSDNLRQLKLEKLLQLMWGKVKKNENQELRKWNEHSDATIKNFIKVNEKLGFNKKGMKMELFYHAMEYYTNTVNLDKDISYFFLDIPNNYKEFPNISKKLSPFFREHNLNIPVKEFLTKICRPIAGLFQCACDAGGPYRYLYKRHKYLASLILDQYLYRYDIRLFGDILKDIKQKKQKDVFDFRDLIEAFMEYNFDIAKQLLCRQAPFKESKIKKITSEYSHFICLKCSDQSVCYGDFNILSFRKEIIQDYNEKVFLSLFNATKKAELDEKFFENNDKKGRLRYGFIKFIASTSLSFSFKYNLLHLGFFPDKYIEGKVIKGFNKSPYLVNYCPKKDKWSIKDEYFF